MGELEMSFRQRLADLSAEASGRFAAETTAAQVESTHTAIRAAIADTLEQKLLNWAAADKHDERRYPVLVGLRRWDYVQTKEGHYAPTQALDPMLDWLRGRGLDYEIGFNDRLHLYAVWRDKS